MSSYDEIQEHARKVGSLLMRDGLTEATMRQLGDFADTFGRVEKADREALFAAAKVEARPKAKVVTVVDHPAAAGATGPIKTKGAKSLGSQQSQTASAPVSCKCGWWAYNDPEVKGAKHAKKGDRHVVTFR